MQYHAPRKSTSPAVATVAVVLALVAAAAPRAARGAVIPLSQSHLLTASVTLENTTVDDSDAGSTIGPVDADARAAIPIPGNNALAELDLTFGSGTISGLLSGVASGTPWTSPVTDRASGNFEYRFMVSEPTPYRLSGLVRIYGRYLGDTGSAEVRLTEDGVRIGGNAISLPPFPSGGGATFDNQGTLLPGRTYALTGSIVAGMVVEPFTNLTLSISDAEFALTVPEPSAACLLAPAALYLVASRRRRLP